MKCYVAFFSESRHEAPFIQKIFLSKKEAHDYVEFRIWECKDRYKKWCESVDVSYHEEDVYETMWVEEKELF